MIVKCQKCGELIVVNGLGRKPLNIPLKKVYEALEKHKDISAAARELGCSNGYIYNKLKSNGLTVRDVISNENAEYKEP